MKRARSLLGALLAAAGLAVIAHAVVTVVWQEPLGALRASAAQEQLGDRYADTAARFSAPVADAAEPPSRADPGRARMLARARTARLLDEQTRAGEPLGRLRIPSIGLSRVWVQSTEAGPLRQGPGHYLGTPLPGRRGTVAIAGHRTTHGAPFRDIDRLDPGDRIELSMPYGRYVYVVRRTRIVAPKDVGVLRPARSDRLVLTACHPKWSAKQRIVVTAELVRWPRMERTRGPAPSAPDDAPARRASGPALPGVPQLLPSEPGPAL